MTQLCWACAQPVASVFTHEHHKRPRAAGGGVRDITNICDSCHNRLHRIAEMLRNPSKVGMVDDALRCTYPQNAIAQQRIKELAMLVVEWLQAKADGAVEPNSEIALTITIPFDIKAALNLMANETRHTNGRAMGVNTYLRGRICAMVYDRFPTLRPTKYQ